MGKQKSRGNAAVRHLRKQVLAIIDELSDRKKKYKSSMEQDRTHLATHTAQIERNTKELVKGIKEEEMMHAKQMKALRNRSHALNEKLMSMRRNLKAVASRYGERRKSLNKNWDRLKRLEVEQKILLHDRANALRHGRNTLARDFEEASRVHKEEGSKYERLQKWVARASKHTSEAHKNSLELLDEINKLHKLVRRQNVEAQSRREQYMSKLSSKTLQTAKRARN